MKSSISKSVGSSNTDLRASGLDMMIKAMAEGCSDDDCWMKDGNPWTNRESVFKYGDKCGVRS